MEKFPAQIKYIIGNEACERFSFYGMRSILTIFMVQYLLFQESSAKSVYHLFVAATYLLPVFGAYLSDRFLGKYRTILYLSIVYCLGHAVLATWENSIGMFIALGLISLGSGGIKPCVSAHVGDQFTSKNSHLLEKVFSLFYFSVNFGSFFSSLLIPWTLKAYGPSIAFGIPGVLMAMATFVFWLGRHKYVHVPPTGVTGKASFLPVFWYALQKNGLKNPRGKFWTAAENRYSADEIEGAQAAVGIFKLFITVSMFWALFDQQGSSWVLQASQMNLNLFGFQLEPSQIQATNPILVMILIPLFSYGLYPLLEKCGIRLTPLRKMASGMVITGLSFLAVSLIQVAIDRGNLVSIGWQFAPYLLITMAEVMVSVTGLEFAYTQAPRSMKSTIMSFWLLTVFVGNLFTAVIAELNIFKGASEFFFYAVLMGAVSLLFIWATTRYRARSFVESETPGV